MMKRKIKSLIRLAFGHSERSEESLLYAYWRVDSSLRSEWHSYIYIIIILFARLTTSTTSSDPPQKHDRPYMPFLLH